MDFYVLPLQGWDIVLGVSWLATLGPIITNYALSTFEFQLNGDKIVWKGVSSPVIQPIQFNGVRRLSQVDGIHSMFQLHIDHSVSPLVTYPLDLAQLLDEFYDVFQPSMGLPPNRSQDHHIALLPNTAPVSVRPYRYPNFQKSEIENLVTDMLQQGIIRPSTSPFSSHVLVVRKKDGMWRFCVDYWALNAIMVRDRFPIPSIDELFDELYGAKYFPKLDFLAGYHKTRIAQQIFTRRPFEHTRATMNF